MKEKQIRRERAIVATNNLICKVHSSSLISLLRAQRPLDQPSFKWNHLDEVKLIYFNKLAQLSASIRTRVALVMKGFNRIQAWLKY